MTPPNPTTAAPGLLYGDPIPPAAWENIRAEFGLPTLDQVRDRLASIYPDPESVMRELLGVACEKVKYPTLRPAVSANERSQDAG